MTSKNQKESCQSCSEENSCSVESNSLTGSNTISYVQVDNSVPQQGWQCPVCKTVWAPFVSSCSKCSSSWQYVPPLSPWSYPSPMNPYPYWSIVPDNTDVPSYTVIYCNKGE